VKYIFSTARFHAGCSSSRRREAPARGLTAEADEHLVAVLRYVERNALRANLVQRAEQWRWCSLRRRLHSAAQAALVLEPWPVPLPDTRTKKRPDGPSLF
jgi:putative transposase